MKVLFLGSSHFSVLVLKSLLEAGVDVSAVITQPDKPSGRGQKLAENEVKRFALSQGIEVKTFDRLRLHMDEVRLINYDIALVASFGQILSDEFLAHRLCINVHPSLLPLYRGASPIQSAILKGDKTSGVTIMKVASKVDAGDILLQEECDISGLYYSEAEEKLALLGGKLACVALDNIAKGKQVYLKQDDEKATFTRKFEKLDGRLDVYNETALLLQNRVRALSETSGTFVELENGSLKVEKAVACKEEIECGKVGDNKKRLLLGCKDGTLEVLVCKSPSGKSISGKDYINGHREILGARIKNA